MEIKKYENKLFLFVRGGKIKVYLWLYLYKFL